MHASLLLLTAIAGLSTADITCDAPIANGPLYWKPASVLSYSGQISLLEPHGNAELVAKYAYSNVIAHNITVIPCNSTFLNAANRSPPFTSSNQYVKLQISDDPTNCLGIDVIGEDNVFLIKQACNNTETDAQIYQFWLRDSLLGGLVPVGAAVMDRTKPDILQIQGEDAEEVIASLDPCTDGNGCQDREHLAFMVKDEDDNGLKSRFVCWKPLPGCAGGKEKKDLESRRVCWGRGCAGNEPPGTSNGTGTESRGLKRKDLENKELDSRTVCWGRGCAGNKEKRELGVLAHFKKYIQGRWVCWHRGCAGNEPPGTSTPPSNGTKI